MRVRREFANYSGYIGELSVTLQGKAALVTGSGTGLGRAITLVDGGLPAVRPPALRPPALRPKDR